MSSEDIEFNWVVVYNMRDSIDQERRSENELQTEADMPIRDKLIICMYYIMTTLGTFGYGDFTPQNTVEKIFNVILQVICAFVFAFIVNLIQGVYKGSMDNKEDQKRDLNLRKWFSIIRKIRLQ